MTFKKWLVQKYSNRDSPLGDLAYDVSRDPTFPENDTGDYMKWNAAIIRYLRSRNACKDCLRTFQYAWRKYVQSEKSANYRNWRTL